jgi:hypothetical protein
MKRRLQRGSSVLYAIILSPTLMLMLGLVINVGALQLEKDRILSAAQVALVSAIDLASSGGATEQIDQNALQQQIRTGLAANLSPLQGIIVGSNPANLAAGADVVVVTTVPAIDPWNANNLLVRPTAEIHLAVPVKTGLLALAGLPNVANLSITASADLRVTGERGRT